MAHEIYQNDSVVSYNGKAMWHGLGTVIDGYPTLEEAWKNSGMNWEVKQFPVQAELDDDTVIELDDRFVNVRMDTKEALGVVGSDYLIVQNEDHWNGFVVPYAEHTNSKIETTGTLKNGRVIWFLLKNGETEIVKNDPISEYYMLSSSHDGSLCTTITDTPIRVVCNNTLSMAINGAKNSYKVRHFSNHRIKIEEIKRAMGIGKIYFDKFKEVMTSLKNLDMGRQKTFDVLNDLIFPKPIAEIDPELLITMPKEREKVPVRAETMRQGKIEKVMQLVEYGKGADIPGVRGTGYGLYQAVAEFYDHHSRTRKTDGKSEEETRFESNHFGSSQKFKEQALNKMLTLV